MNVNRELLYQQVKFLTTLRPFRNFQNLDSWERVCDYLQDQFSEFGLEVVEPIFRVHGSEYKNLIASYNQSASRRLIV